MDMPCYGKAGGIDNTTRFDYDKARNLVGITDNQSRKIAIEYDLMSHKIKRIERDGSVTRQFYDIYSYQTRWHHTGK